jgi:hypothetical protein
LASAAGEKTMMLLPGWRSLSRERARLLMSKNILNARFGVAIA